MISITAKVFKLGVTSFLISGVLFFAYFIFTFLISNPALNSDKLSDWMNESRLFIAIADELLLFATVFFLLSIYILAKILKADQFPMVLAGCIIIKFFIIPVFMLIVLLQGRLAYPVYDQQLSTDIISFIVSLWIGAMHALSILLAVSILLLSLSLRKGVLGRLPVLIGIPTSLCQFISAYPWLIHSTLHLLFQLTFPIWLISMGVLLLAKREAFIPLLQQNKS